MIYDIHTHILYGIDDGSRDREMSLQLLGMAYEQGVRGVFLTNHSYGMDRYYRDYYIRFDELKKLAGDMYPELSLFKGCEILCYRDEMEKNVRKIRDGVYPALNGTKYVLIEFDPLVTKGVPEMEYCIDKVLNAGYIPVIAHVERYHKLYDDPLADIRKLKDLGCRVQVNLYSVEQDQGKVGGGTRKILANMLLSDHLVDFVGTDTHNTEYKSPEAAVGARALREKYGDNYADEVLYKNAENMLI